MRLRLFASGLLVLAAAGCGGASNTGSKSGGSAAGKCGEVAFGQFPGVQAGDKPELPKAVEEREVAAGPHELKLGLHVCVGPNGNVIAAEVKEPSQSTELDAHVKQVVEGWTFCTYVPDRTEKEPRCDTLRFQFQIKPVPAPASAPTTPTAPPAATPPPATPAKP
jgi:hypothetical protein